MDINDTKEHIGTLYGVALHLLYIPERPNDRNLVTEALKCLQTSTTDDTEWSKRVRRLDELFSFTPLFSTNPKKHYSKQSGYQEIVDVLEGYLRLLA